MAVAINSLLFGTFRQLIVAVATVAVGGVAPPAQGAEKAFTYVLSGEPESLDSAKTTSEGSIHVTWLLCDTLLNISKDGQRLEPGLAESWSASRDGLHVTMKLRPRVLLHDGTPVDGGVVKASLERQFRPGHELYSADPRNSKERMLSDLVDDIQVQDGLTLVLKLKYPGLHYLSQIDIVSPGAVARLGKDFGRRPVCSGPFKFDSWSQDRIVVTANEKYWAGRPRVERVTFRFIPEARAIADGLVKGEIDFTPTVRDPTLFERVRESSRVTLVTVSGLNVYYLGFYTERPPFSSVALRQAVVRAINVARAALALGRGAAAAAKGPLAPAMKGYDPAVNQAPYDPEAARELLGKTGQTSPLTVGLVHNNAVAFDSEISAAIQSDLRRIGIGVELLGKPTGRDFTAAVQARAGDMFLYSWHLRAPYPERLLVPLFHSRSPRTTNLTHYGNPEIDKLLDEALRFPEGPAQNRIYLQIQKLIVEDAPMVFLYHSTRIAAHANRVHGLELNLGALPYDKLVKVDLRP